MGQGLLHFSYSVEGALQDKSTGFPVLVLLLRTSDAGAV